VAGFVKRIYVDVGDRVNAGQLLATLEIPEAQDEVRQAEASVRRSEEEIRRAQADSQRSQSVHEVTHLAYTRLAAVSKSKPGLVAQQEIDDSAGKDRVAEAQVATTSAELAASEAQLEVAKANEARLRTMLAYAQISAPFAGVITKRYADTGSMIQAGTSSSTQSEPLVRLAENSTLRLVIPVPESAVPDIHLGTLVDVNVPVLHRTFPGKVVRFADQLDLGTRTMHTEVDVPNPKLELVPGLYAEASVVVKQVHNALTAPIPAITRVGDTSTVYAVTKNGKVEERTVQVGIETASDVEILSGLQRDDLVVVGDRTRIRPGDTVQPSVSSEVAARGGN
jgi:RND family efflux transporter MFP subunit